MESLFTIFAVFFLPALPSRFATPPVAVEAELKHTSSGTKPSSPAAARGFDIEDTGLVGTGDGSAAGVDGVNFGAGSVGLTARAGFLYHRHRLHYWSWNPHHPPKGSLHWNLQMTDCPEYLPGFYLSSWILF